MAPPKKNAQPAAAKNTDDNSLSSVDNFVNDLVKDLNKEHGERIAYNLGTDMSPTHVERWISTGSRQLDYIISNKRNGGVPEGRIIEIFAAPSTGKSHIAILIARATQRMGGVAVYIDTENATSPENLSLLGVNVRQRFAFVETGCTEEVFKVMESTIMKFRALDKNVPLTIIWDSVAATSPKSELEGDYDKDTIGLQARVLSKGLRKITQIIGNKNVTLILLNQTRTKVGVMYGDPTTTPGGMAIPFMASVRIKITGGSHIEVGEGNDKRVIGINVTAKTVKNKVANPFRACDFQIHFGRGIFEHEEIFDVVRNYSDKNLVISGGKRVKVEGTGAWKTFTIADNDTGEVLLEKKFNKKEFGELLENPQYKLFLDDLIEQAYTIKTGDAFVPDFDENSYVEAEAVAIEKVTTE